MGTSAEAFDRLYAGALGNDPWASGSPTYRYQGLKYDTLSSLLPTRRFSRALDIGCGLGLLTERLASRAHHVLDIDISAVATIAARARTSHVPNVRYAQGDLLSFDAALSFPRLHSSRNIVGRSTSPAFRCRSARPHPLSRWAERVRWLGPFLNSAMTWDNWSIWTTDKQTWTLDDIHANAETVELLQRAT